VPFLGYEFCDSVGTLELCDNVIFPASTGKVFSSLKLKRKPNSSVGELISGITELWDRLFLLNQKAIGIVAAPPTGISWDFSKTRLEKVVGAEISTTGGSTAKSDYRNCQNTVTDALRQGLHMQVLGSGNDHEGRPGRSSLTAVIAKNLSRESILEAIQSRRTYTTRGTRLMISFNIDGHQIGEKFVPPSSDNGLSIINLTGSVTSPTTSLQSISIFRLKNLVKKRILFLEKESLALQLIGRDTVSAGETAVYWAEVSLKDQASANGSEAWTSPITVRRP
jgi:hypothetical protein